MWVPVQFSGINQSSQRNSLVPLISWFYYFPDSQPVSPYPHLSLLYRSPAKPRRGFFSLYLPFHHCRAFSCRRGSFIRLYTQKSQIASTGLSLWPFWTFILKIKTIQRVHGLSFLTHTQNYFAYHKNGRGKKTVPCCTTVILKNFKTTCCCCVC